MPRRQLKTDDEEGFLRAFRDEVLDLAIEYDVHIKMWLDHPRQQPGMVIRADAYRHFGTSDERLYARAYQEYPSHSANRLHAALYRAAIKLGGAIRESIRANSCGDEQAP